MNMLLNTVRRMAVWFGLVLACASVQGVAAASVSPSANAQMPDALIEKVSTDVLETIRGDAALKNGDMTRINQLIDEKVLPHVDFEKMTRLSVGLGWRQATAEQRVQLVQEFRTLLVRTYSGAVSAVKDHQVKMRPFRMRPEDKQVLVRSNVVPSSGEAIQLDYRLEKTDSGWKIFDINVLGVWLVANYKSQFASTINASGIDGLIKQLKDQNASHEAKQQAAPASDAKANGAQS